MIYLALSLFGVIFLELFVLFDIVKTARSIISESQESLQVLMSSEMDDERKEAYMRSSSLELFKATGFFMLKFVFIAAILYLFYLALIAFFPSLEDALIQRFVSPSVIVLLTLATIGYAWVRDVILKQLQSS